MSDEAFARRFYSDRAELTALGVPLTSQRDEFTGEELYTLRSEHYFLDELELADDELAALQTALYTLEGKFAYAEPLRLALQNLALGRPGFRHAPTDTAERVRVTAPDYSPELAARLSKLEAAISKQRTIQFRYWSPSRDKETERRLNPYALRLDEGVWYVVGHDLDRDAIRTFRVSRVRSDIRFATRRERDFRQPEEFDVEAHRIPRPWQIGPATGTARIEVQGDTAWWVHRTLADAARWTDGVFETSYSTPRAARLLDPAAERPRDPARAGRAPRRGRRRAAHAPRPSHRRRGRARARAARRGASDRRGATARRPGRAGALRRPPGAPRAPARRVRRRAARDPGGGRARAALLDPAGGAPGDPLAPQPRQLRRRVLHGLRGGRRGDRSRPGRQGALRRRLPQAAEADAARGARDPARDRVRRADDRRRRAHAARARPAEARGDLRPVRLRPDPGEPRRRRRGGARQDALPGRGEAPPRRARVPQGGRGGAVDAPRRAVHDRARASVLARPHLGSHRRRPAHVPARPNALGEAHERALRAARRASTRTTSPSRPSRGSGTRRRSPAGSSSGAPASSRTRRRSRRSRSRPRSGSSPRCSPTAARRSCSSRRRCAARSSTAPARFRPSSGSAPGGGGRQSEPEPGARRPVRHVVQRAPCASAMARPSQSP